MAEIGNIYQHYKGGVYKLICIAKMESSKSEMAVYESVLSGKIWIRPTKQFEEKFSKYEIAKDDKTIINNFIENRKMNKEIQKRIDNAVNWAAGVIRNKDSFTGGTIAAAELVMEDYKNSTTESLREESASSQA